MEDDFKSFVEREQAAPTAEAFPTRGRIVEVGTNELLATFADPELGKRLVKEYELAGRMVMAVW